LLFDDSIQADNSIAAAEKGEGKFLQPIFCWTLLSKVIIL